MPADDEVLFAPFDMLSDGDSFKPIHRKIKRDSYVELCKDDFVGDAATLRHCASTGNGYVAHCEEKLGMAFFSQNDIW